jgi:hypothetical protein
MLSVKQTCPTLRLIVQLRQHPDMALLCWLYSMPTRAAVAGKATVETYTPGAPTYLAVTEGRGHMESRPTPALALLSWPPRRRLLLLQLVIR